MIRTKLRPAISILSFSLILAYVAVAASGPLGDFAPLPLEVLWLYVASFVVGLAMALMYSETGTVFGGFVLIALLTGALYAAALAAATLGADPRLSDVIGLYAFQQAFPFVLSISIFGLSGAFMGAVGKHMFGSA
jgi:hypothetical protein